MAKPTLRTSLKSWGIAFWWVLFGVGYFSSRYFDPSPVPVFLAHFFYLGVAALVLAAAAGYGWPLADRWLPTTLSPGERVLFAAGTGLGLMSLLMFGAGLVGLWTRFGALLLVTGGLATGAFFSHYAGFPASRQNDPVVQGPGLLTGLGIVLSFLVAFTPVTYYDSLVYHFALPQAYAHSGRWIGLPDLIYSSFPQNMEMLWTLGLLLMGEAAANLIGWTVALLGIAGVYLFARRFLGQGTARWAAALLATMPAYLLLSSGGYVDVGLTVFSFLSFYILCLWDEDPRPRILVAAGFLAGCAIGVKYTGAIPLAIGGLMIVRRNGIMRLHQNVADLLIYGSTAMLVFSPWLIKNLHYVGNPVFPFFYQWSLNHLSPWVGEAAAGYFKGLVEYHPRSGLHLIKLLWDIGVNGLDFGGGMDVLGDLGWGILFAFLPALWWVKGRAHSVSLLLFYAISFFIPWGMSRPVLRFLMPVAPVLALLAAYAFDQGLELQARWLRAFGRIVLASLWISGLWLFFQVAELLSLFRVPMGFEGRSDYLAQKLDYFGAASYVNSLPEDTLTYVVGDQRRYYYNRPVIVTPVFNVNPLTEWVNDASSPEDLAVRLKARHITHLLINYSELNRLDGIYHLFPFTANGRANWQALCSRLAKPLYRDTHCEVLAL